MPSISIIMPCYNASAYLQEAINSVLSQSYQDWELIIVDDGSADESQAIAKEYATKDKRIRLLVQPNSGACRARNNGLKHAEGKYIKFLDADDVLDKDCLRLQVEQIEKLRPYQIPFGDYGRINKDSEHISEYVFSKEMLQQLHQDAIAFTFFHWEILITCPLHRKQQLLDIGSFDERLPRHQETDLHFRLALAGIKYVHYSIHTFDYREYESVNRISTRYTTGGIDKAQLNEVYYRKNELLLKERYGEIPETYRSTFANYYYSCARDAFATFDTQKGMEFLKKSFSYIPFSGSKKCYDFCGKVLGYTRIESLLRFRLRLLHKA